MGKSTKAQQEAKAKENGQVEEQLDGLLVNVTYGENGDVSTSVQTLGSVRVTEIPTVLELALSGVRKQLGFDKET